MSEDVFIPESRCPNCGYVCDVAMKVKTRRDAVPKEGDVSICIKCAGLSEFTADLQRRPFSAEALAALPAADQTEVYNAMIAVRAVNAKPTR